MATNKEIPATGSGDGQTPPPLAPPIDAITKIELFLEKNWRAVVAVLLAFIAAVVVFFYLKYKKEDEITRSNQAFSSAVSNAELNTVVEEHPGTVAAGSALFTTADRQIKAANPDGAAATLNQFITDYPDHPMQLDALVGLGGISQKKGDYDKALEYFQKVIDTGEGSAKRPLAAIFKGETLVAKGELEKAKEHYEAFGKNYPGTFVRKAEERLAAVEKRIALAAAPKAPVEPEDPKPEPKPEVKPAPPAPTPPAKPAPTPGAENTPATPAPAVEAGEAAETPAAPAEIPTPPAPASTPVVEDPGTVEAPAAPAETPEPAAGGDPE